MDIPLQSELQWSPDNSHKIRENFVRIIHTSESMEKNTILQITIVRIIRDVRISKGQIIRAYCTTKWICISFNKH